MSHGLVCHHPRKAPFLPGPTFAGPYHAAGDPASAPLTYGRHNPTWTAYEQALSELEGDQPLSLRPVCRLWRPFLELSSALAMLSCYPADSYYTTRVLAEGYFTQMGIQVRMAPTVGNAQQQALTGAKLLWLESPSNPGLDVCDIAALATAAHVAGRWSRWTTRRPPCWGSSPALGADFSMASDTKALTGHSDLILGHVATREQEWADRPRVADAARGDPGSNGSG